MNIQMVDVKSQYMKIKETVNHGILEVLNNTSFINGPAVKKFQTELEDYLNIPHVIPCANGTDALQIAMMALDLKPGDEVIVPAFTYVATAEVIALLGLTPVMVDVNPETFNIEPESILQALSPKTKAIVPVHLYGQSAPMDEIMEIAEKNHIWVIEDNAQAIGADYYNNKGQKAKTGTIGHIGCTSFYPSKNLGCYGDGGALCTHDTALADNIRKIANHGQSERYYHDIVGCNSRLDSIQAVVLSAKLPHLNAYCDARRTAADIYDKTFKNIPALEIPFRAPWSTHVFHQYTLKVKNGHRDELKDYLDGQKIPSMIYYPVPLYKQKAFKAFSGGIDFLPHTEKLCREVISLPMHTELTDEQLNFITQKVTEFFHNHP